MQESIQSNTKNIEAIRSEYDRLFLQDSVRDEKWAYEWHAKELLRLNPLPDKVLDVACGCGHFLRELRRASPQSMGFGVDFSNEAIKRTNLECPFASTSVAAAEALPFKNNLFDALVCLGSLEHFFQVTLAVEEMIRVTKPGGYLYILVPNEFWLRDIVSVVRTGDKVERNQTREMFGSLGEWRKLFLSAGLQVLKIKKYNGISKNPIKQTLKNMLIPLTVSYHFVFICQKK